MGRRLRCCRRSVLALRSGKKQSETLRLRALPAAHFERNDVTIICETVHQPLHHHDMREGTFAKREQKLELVLEVQRFIGRSRCCFDHECNERRMAAVGHMIHGRLAAFVGQFQESTVSVEGTIRFGQRLRQLVQKRPASQILSVCYVINTHEPFSRIF